MFWLFKLQEAEAFALYHKALDLQKHDRFEESAKAYHELLEIRLLREVSDLQRMKLYKLLLYFVWLNFLLANYKCQCSHLASFLLLFLIWLIPNAHV